MMGCQQESTIRRRALEWSCVGLALLSAAMLLRVAASSAVQSGVVQRPVLLLEQTTWDFGTVAEGSRLETNLRIRNPGGQRLVVNEETCALCGLGAMPTMIMGPGQRMDVTLQWETEGAEGHWQQERRFTSNDPQQPGFGVSVSAVVVRRSASAMPEPLRVTGSAGP